MSNRHGDHSRRSYIGSVGKPPGTMEAIPGAQPPLIHVTAFGPDACIERVVQNLDEIKEVYGKYPVTWVSVDGLGDPNVITDLGKMFGLHPLALEDVTNIHQRPKVEQYGEHLFVATRMAMLNEELYTQQLSLFLGSNFIVTFDEDALDPLRAVRQRIVKDQGRMRQHGPDYLAYCLLDAAIDSFFPVLESYGERLEQLEEQILRNPARRYMSGVHLARRDLLTLRRAVWPQRDSFNALIRDPSPLVGDEARLYLRDCYDHVSQLIDMIETYRDLGSSLIEIYQSGVANRTNDVMKVLTIIATIFIPLSFLASLWGMNFDPDTSPLNMPELRWKYGYPMALAIMAVTAGLLLANFARRGWLGRSESTDDRPE